MEDHVPQPGQPLEDSAAIADRLRKLEEEAAALRAALHSSPAVEPAVASTEPPPPTESAKEIDEEPDPATLEKVDKLLARYRIESARGNREMGAQYLKEAQALAPRSSTVLEVLGDDAASRRQMKEAIDFYRQAKEADPKNLSADRKHADLVFRTQAAQAAVGISEFENVASAKSATVLSIFVPGLGHMVTGQVGKGLGYLLVWLGSLVWFVLTPNGIQGLIAMVSNRSEPKLNMLVLVPMFLGLVTWLVAMIDMNSRSKTLGRGLGKGGGPKPPVDLPF